MQLLLSNSIPGIINDNALFNKKSNISNVLKDPPIDKDFTVYLSNLSERIRINFDNNEYNIAVGKYIKKILKNEFSNFNSVFQIGFDNGYYSTCILEGINKKHVGNKQVTCISGISNHTKIKRKIDLKYGGQIKLLLCDIFEERRYRDISSNIILVTQILNRNELLNIIFLLSSKRDTQIIFFHIRDMSVFDNLEDRGSVVIDSKKKFIDNTYAIAFKFTNVKFTKV